jgi:drug/metabolite transporter (DMT)-like permease
MNLSFLWIIFAGICWWLDGLLRSQISGVSPLTIVTVEHAIGFVILAVIGIKHFSFPKLSTKAWFALIGVALFSGLIGTYAFTWAMAHVHYSSFGVLFLLLKLQPLFAILTALIFLGERPKLSFYPLAVLAVISAYFLSFWKNGLHVPDLGSDTARAVWAGLVAALCWGSATVFSRFLSHQGYKARTMTAFRLGMVALLGVIALGIFSLLVIDANQQWTFNVQQLTLIGWVALLSGVLGTTMYYRGIKHVHATSASIFELAFPITGFIIDIFVQHKTPDTFQILGGIFLVIVMIFVARTKKS